MKEKMVCVEWDDASFNSGYYDKKTPERFEQTRTRTLGFIVQSTPKEGEYTFTVEGGRN